MYYVDVQDGKIVSKNEVQTIFTPGANQIEISQELHDQLQIPATFEVDEQGNIINFTPVIKDPSVVTEPVDEEKVWMAEALIQQEAEIEELKARLVAAGL